MKILILDDMKERYSKFFQNLKKDGVEIDWALTADDAIAKLNKGEDTYQYVFLDHDLDEGAYVGTPHEKTGMDVVKFICNFAKWFKSTMFIVHSLNTPAAKVMYDTLLDSDLHAELLPFAWERVKAV